MSAPRGGRRTAGAKRRSAGAGRGATGTGRRGTRRAAPEPGLDRLWSPWRMEYVGTASEPAGCLFCRVARSRDDRAHLVVARRKTALLVLNRYPYNPAHLMVAVHAHKASFRDLSARERGDLLALTALAEATLEREYAPHGVNVGANLGRVAGAGFPGHLHLHLVPRWNGDTNFMPVIGATRVLPESLERTWERLRGALAPARRVAGRRRRPSRGQSRP